jgi:menaquinol-cytochrome c reductase iron-sulfur subunit
MSHHASHPDYGNTPSQPEGSEPVSAQEMNRRKFLALLSIVPGAVATAAIGLPVAGFVAAPLFAPPVRQWLTIGKLEDFKIGETVKVDYADPSPLPWAGVTAKSAAWVRRVGETEFIGFAVNCSHLGCPVRWLSSAELFMCPCHGGVYYKDGSVAAGPPPHALSRYQMRIEDGQVQLQTRDIPIA